MTFSLLEGVDVNHFRNESRITVTEERFFFKGADEAKILHVKDVYLSSLQEHGQRSAFKSPISSELDELKHLFTGLQGRCDYFLAQDVECTDQTALPH